MKKIIKDENLIIIIANNHPYLYYNPCSGFYARLWKAPPSPHTHKEEISYYYVGDKQYYFFHNFGKGERILRDLPICKLYIKHLKRIFE